MADWLSSPESVIITVPEAINEENITFYEIQVKIDKIQWKVRRRYREFDDLHENLVEKGVDKDSLPEKKLIGSKDPSFIMKRRRDLESYLQSVFSFLQHSLPQVLANFLHLCKYDQHFILREIASHHFELMTSEILKDESNLTPLHLHSISKRLKSSNPPLMDDDEKQYDFTHVADFACGLKTLRIEGNYFFPG